MKKIKSFLLVFLALILAGCGTKASESETKKAAAKETTKKEVETTEVFFEEEDSSRELLTTEEATTEESTTEEPTTEKETEPLEGIPINSTLTEADLPEIVFAYFEYTYNKNVYGVYYVTNEGEAYSALIDETSQINYNPAIILDSVSELQDLKKVGDVDKSLLVRSYNLFYDIHENGYTEETMKHSEYLEIPESLNDSYLYGCVDKSNSEHAISISERIQYDYKHIDSPYINDLKRAIYSLEGLRDSQDEWYESGF